MRTVSLCALAGMCVSLGTWWLISGGPVLEAAPENASAAMAGGLPADLSASPLVTGSRHLARVAALVMPSVVHIQSERTGRGGTVEETGSGVIMRSPKYSGLFVVTNRHVVAEAALSAIEIHVQDGRVVHPTSRDEDIATDVAVLKVDAAELSPAQWGDSDNLDIGHMVLAVGSPFGLSESVTLGIISAKGRRALQLSDRREVINQDFLQTDAAINPGNSGGPLIDLGGHVVGLNTAIASQGGGNEGIGFSIPSNLVRYVVDQLLENGKVSRSYLGVRLDDSFDDAAAKRFNLDRARGARVLQVYPDTPAAKAGIEVNDIILNFNGIAIEDEEHLIHRVSLTKVNSAVRVIVLRNGKQVTLQVTLTDRPDPNAHSTAPEVLPQLLPPGLKTEKTGFTRSLSLAPLTGPLARQLGYSSESRGVLVMQVPATADADAVQALQLYDVIEEVDRIPVCTGGECMQLLEQEAAKGPVVLKVRRFVDSQAVTRLVLWAPPN